LHGYGQFTLRWISTWNNETRQLIISEKNPNYSITKVKKKNSKKKKEYKKE